MQIIGRLPCRERVTSSEFTDLLWRSICNGVSHP